MAVLRTIGRNAARLWRLDIHFYVARPVADILRELCEGIFIEQLASRFTDTTTWGQDRSFDVFCRWFDLQHHSMLVDLCDEPLIRETDC